MCYANVVEYYDGEKPYNNNVFIGVGLITICTIGIVLVAADDVTVIGIADDFLFGPLGAGITEGVIMIFE